MADATATFALVFEDDVSGAADEAAASLDALKASIEADTKSLSAMNKSLRQMRAGGLSGSSTFKDLKAQADVLKVSIGAQAERFQKLGGSYGKTAAAAAPLVSKTTDLAGALAGANGPLGAMAGGLSRLGPLLSNPVTIVVALAAAFVSLAAAVVTATAAMLKFGIAQSDARRAEALQIEGLNTLRHWYGRTTASVAEFQAAIDRASDSTNIGRGQLQGYARSLSRAGLRGAALTEAVEAMGIAAQVQGERGANRFRALAMNARLTGGSVQDLAADYRNRLGPIARRQMLEIGNQTDRARRSLDRIFSGLRTEALLGALDDVLSLLSQSTQTGRTLKALFETIFQPLADDVAFLGPAIKRFFQGVVIGALLVIIQAQRLRNAWRDAFGESTFLDDLNVAKAALISGAVVFGVFAVAVTSVAIAIGAVVAAWALFFATMAAVPTLIAAAVAGIVAGVSVIVDWFQETDFAGLGRSMVDGIVAGIRSATSSLTSAVRGLADSAADTFRETLGIQSPSTVFAGFGLNVAQGAAVGIEAGTPAVEDAAANLVDAPTGAGVGGATSITIGDVVIQGAGASDARELAIAFRDELATVLEGVSISLGVPA